MTTLRFRLPLATGEPALLELDTHRGTAAGREITLDAGGRLTLHLADGSTLTADLARRPRIDLAPFPPLALKVDDTTTDTTA